MSYSSRTLAVRRGGLALAVALSSCIGAQTAAAAAAPADSKTAEPRQGTIEEVIVTAQRRAESVQEVPIAVTALSGQMLKDRQVINTSDLQMNAPNVSFTATNFGGSSLSIRGIGRLVTATSGDPGVAIHTNEIPISPNLNAAEFYDMERVEVLRGPQGTLYGRNATGGVIDFVTAKPTFDEFKGNVDVEAGDYGHERVKGAINIPMADNFAIRAAGMYLKRDGYIDNLAHDAGVPGVDSTLDGRDLYSYRITAKWDISDRASGWAMYTKFHENDDKARITNQVCVKNPLPTTGCVPDAYGFQGVNQASTTGGMFFGFAGVTPKGAADAADGLVYKYPRPTNLGLRKVFTDYQPQFRDDEESIMGGLKYDLDKVQVSLIGGYQTTTYVSRQDYNMDVGPTLNPTVQFDANAYFAGQDPLGAGVGIVPVTAYPTSQVSGGLKDPKCNLQAGTFGLEGGCANPKAPTDRVFSYDQSDAQSDYWTGELKVQSDFDGPFNFLLGVNDSRLKSSGNYFVVANSLDVVDSYGSPFFGFPPLYPGVYDSTTSNYTFDSTSAFGEAYYQFTPDLKLTVGLRYNLDDKQVHDAGYLYNAIDLSTTCFGAGLGGDCSGLAGFGLTPLTQKTFVRTEAVGYVLGSPIDPATQALVDYYGLTDQAASAVTLDDRLAVVQGIPLAPTPNEARALTGSPSKDKNKEMTGRIGLNWQVNDQSMVYGFLSRGYKPAGFNPPVNPSFQASTPFTFDSEQVDSLEVGSKNTLMNDTMILNATVFGYKYKGLQIASIQNNTAVNQNVDAQIFGAELELNWRPEPIPNLSVDASYSYLNTKVDNGTRLLDTVDRTQGDPNLILLKNIDSGSNTGINYVANVADVAAVTQAAIAANKAVDLPGVANATDPTGTNPNGIPAYFSRSFLQAQFDAGNISAAPTDGVLANIGGNELPNSPKNTIHLGLAYSFNLSFGTLTPRWDYYWQDDSYAREYNRKGDVIKSWDQHNLSLIFESAGGRWGAKAWVRNAADKDNVTGHYVTSDTSGLFQNYFLTEPRIYGASVQMNF